MESDRVTRLKGWEKRFIRLAEEELAKPFDWQVANCGHLMAVAIIACHGPNHPILAVLNECSSEQAVIELLAAEGGLSGILSGHFQKAPVPILGGQADIGIYMGKVYNRHSTEFQEIEAGCIILDGVAVGKAEGTNRPVRLPIRNLKAVYVV